MVSRTSGKRGFTLVELLVVIGIIAVLVGILLPVVNRVRRQGKLIACQSNLRSIGQAMFIYAAENKGNLPWGFVYNTYNPQTGAAIAPNFVITWATLINNVMNPRGTSKLWQSGKFSKAFQCPEFPDSFNQPICYGFHSVAMPNMTNEIAGNTWGGPTPPGQPLIKTATLDQLYPDNALAWDTYAIGAFYTGSPYGDFGERYSFVDGGQLCEPDANAYPSGYQLRYRGKLGVPEPERSDPYLRPDYTIFMWAPDNFPDFEKDEARNDGYRWNYHIATPRFRHGSNDTCNTLFADGSVKGVKLFANRKPTGSQGADSEWLRAWIMIKPPF